MIAVIDYGMGNLRSVQKAFEFIGAKAVITSDPATILSAKSVVLPGVGAFKACMDNLRHLNLIDVVHQSVDSGKPFLGICLGLQLLFDESEEFDPVPGLGILPGRVKAFPKSLTEGEAHLKIPHMGWNTVHVAHPNPLFNAVDNDSYFYFVHSYYVEPDDPAVIATTTNYGIEFVSGIQRDNVHAFQFHPEKSQSLGLSILKNFAALN
jgi:glutamine amidotransferase